MHVRYARSLNERSRDHGWANQQISQGMSAGEMPSGTYDQQNPTRTSKSRTAGGINCRLTRMQ